eukprot:m51a1_g8604 hypothetical protein (687) ;mRNA; f:189266-192442
MVTQHTWRTALGKMIAAQNGGKADKVDKKTKSGSPGSAAEAMKSIRDNIASLSRLELTQRLQAAVGERPEVQQTVGDVLGPVVGRRVDTAEISDAEGEGLAELVGEASDTGYSRAVAEMARRAPAVTARVLVEAVARAEGSGDRAAREYARRGLETVGSRGVAGLVWAGVQRLPQVLLLFPVVECVGQADGNTAGPVPAIRETDVVAHTVGYAVLDALRPQWAEGVGKRPEGGVLHEAFADLAALLVPLASPCVCAAVVAQTRCDLRATAVAARQQSAVGDALGISAVLSACSALTARDLWDPAGKPIKAGPTRSSRDVSAMVTSALWAAVASAHRALCRRSAPAAAEDDSKEKGQRRWRAAEDPAEVLGHLADMALRTLVAACLCETKDEEAPTLVDFCESLVKSTADPAGQSRAKAGRAEGGSKPPDGATDMEAVGGPEGTFREALRSELERRHLLRSAWVRGRQEQQGAEGSQPAMPTLDGASIQHTGATVRGFVLLSGASDKMQSGAAAGPDARPLALLAMPPGQRLPVMQQSVHATRRTASSNRETSGPARRMCECIAMAAEQATRTVESPVSRQLWATLRTGAQQALDDTEDEVGAWEGLVETWGAVEREAAGQVFGERRMWSAIVVEAADEPTEEGIRESVRKLVLSLEYVKGYCNESPSGRLWGQVLNAVSNSNAAAH